MTDATAGPGHNQPPDDDFQTLRSKVNEFGRSAVEWGEHGIATPDDAEKVNDFITGARGLFKDIDEARKAEKKPHDDAAKAVQEKYRPLLDAIEKVGKTAKELLTAYQTKIERELAERQRREAEAAAQREAEAQARVAEAKAAGDVVSAAEAEKAAQDAAEAAERAAAKDAAVARVGSSSGAARTASMRTFRSAQIANIRLALVHYMDTAEVRDLILKLANADIRAAKGADIEIPGIEIVEDRRIA